jgi:predicted ArsR family transcriptional regulator
LSSDLPLFAYQPHSPTSAAAAIAIEPAAGTLRRRVLEVIRSKPSTDEEIQDLLRMNPSTERPRRQELVQSGLVVDSGTTRKTRAGRAAVVWRCV